MIDMKGNFKKNLNGLSPSNICRQRGSEINMHIIVRLKFSSIIYLFVFSDKCETATKVRNLRNISRHVEKHFRGKLQQTSLSADINENERKQKKTTKKTPQKTNICRQRGLKNQACASSYVWRSLPPFIYLSIYLFVFIYWPFSGTAEAIHTARLLQLVPLIRGAWLVIKEQQTF